MIEIPITVYTPVYNGERYIAETIESVLEQSFSNFEYLIINDGSIDKTEDVIVRYANRDSRIRVISQQNQGVSAAANVAINNASGKYLVRIDADDICLPGRFATQYEYMENFPQVVVCGGLIRLFGDVSVNTPSQAENDSEIRVFFLSNPAISNSTSCVRTSFIRKNDFLFDTDIFFGEDFDFWSRMSFLEECRFYNIQKPLVSYRVHSLSATQSVDRGKKDDFLKKIRLRHIHLLETSPSESEIEIHGMLVDRKSNFGLDDLRRAEIWIKKLIKANEQLGIYDHKTLTTLLVQRLYHAANLSEIQSSDFARWLLKSEVLRCNISSSKLACLAIKHFVR